MCVGAGTIAEARNGAGRMLPLRCGLRRLGEDVAHVRGDGVEADAERSAISRLLFPAATRRSTSTSRWLRPSGEAHWLAVP